MSRIRIGLMYADPQMVQARRMLFGTQPQIDVVFDESLASAALELVPESTVDVLVVDTRLRGMSGVDFTYRMHRRYLSAEVKLPKVILTTPFFSEQLLLEAIRAGATDLVTESDGASALISAIESAMVPSPDMNYAELKKFFELTGVEAGSNQRWLLRLSDLSEGERKVLELLKHGLNDRKLSEALDIPETRVRWSIESLMNRMQVANRGQFALALYESGVLVADGKIPKRI